MKNFFRRREDKILGQGLIATQINEIEKILTSTDLIAERNPSPAYKDLKAADFRNLRYIDVWKKCYENRFYDFRLKDDALIQFRIKHTSPVEISYAFYECPYLPLLSFEEFFEKEEFERGEGSDEYEILRDYELLTREIKDFVTPLRYDYAPNMYTEGLHPASHMHFGHQNNIRVATKRMLLPLSFALFLIRQHYPTYWTILKKDPDSIKLFRNVSENLSEISKDYWNAQDNWEMSLV